MKVIDLLKLTGPPPQRSVLLKAFHNTDDIVKAVIAQHEINRVACAKIAKKFDANTDYQVCKNLWEFTHYNLAYYAEGNTQKTKGIAQILTDAKNGVGNDCKHYSNFIGGVLEQLEVPFFYRFAYYPDEEGVLQIQHVYIVCPGIAICDGVLPYFDSEKPCEKKLDIQIKKKKICHSFA